MNENTDLLPESLFEKALRKSDVKLSNFEIINLVDFFIKVYYKDMDIKEQLEIFWDEFV